MTSFCWTNRTEISFQFCSIVICFICSCSISSAYQQDIGFERLKSEKNEALATGTNILINQIEASSADDNQPAIYFPDITHSEFVNVTFVDKTSSGTQSTSGHATSMARYMVGETLSQTPGIKTVNSYETLDWLNTTLFSGAGSRPLQSNEKLANHSWVAVFDENPITLDIFQRLDWIIDQHNFIQVVGYIGDKSPVLSSAFNVIAVRNISPPVDTGSAGLNDIYTAGRSLPHVVVPVSTTSVATAVVSSSVALMMDQTFPAVLSVEAIKAVLMAGAIRHTDNTANGDIKDYRQSVINQTDNGLDKRFGAGQLNIYNSFQMMDNGRQQAVESGGSDIKASGYAYVASFGGQNGSLTEHNYPFKTGPQGGKLAVSLVWNLNLNEDGAGVFNPVPVLYNFDLQLVDVTEPQEVIIARSESMQNNTENLWLDLSPGRKYQLRVLSKEAKVIEWDYALAWRIERPEVLAVPIANSVQILLAASLYLILFIGKRVTGR